mmetsp:Transcript_1343/g.3117  ORF Transcript_1343/g.3117 Transcript_1343/m.3117 type:complete len:234 (-) Transcript_1343:599-1300(-)
MERGGQVLARDGPEQREEAERHEPVPVAGLGGRATQHPEIPRHLRAGQQVLRPGLPHRPVGPRLRPQRKARRDRRRGPLGDTSLHPRRRAGKDADAVPEDGAVRPGVRLQALERRGEAAPREGPFGAGGHPAGPVPRDGCLVRLHVPGRLQLCNGGGGQRMDEERPSGGSACKGHTRLPIRNEENGDQPYDKGRRFHALSRHPCSRECGYCAGTYRFGHQDGAQNARWQPPRA